MKIVADENIPQVKEAFENFGNVILQDGRKISNKDVIDADVLLVRSITNVNGSLLKNSKVKFVATATIGTDHVDTEYLHASNIFFIDAKGCNAFSVAEYVVCAVTDLFSSNGKKFSGKTFGVVGYGNIGTKVARFANALGFNVLINDPPLQRINYPQTFHPLTDVLNCDVVTFHVPLNKEGVDKTLHMINNETLGLIRSGSVLINSSRGPVVQNEILKERIIKKKNLFTVLDVWENEPNIDSELLSLVDFGTPHIAGYSLEGKLNGTLIIYNKFCEHFNFTQNWVPNYPSIVNKVTEINSEKSIEETLQEICSKIYDIKKDSAELKSSVNFDDEKRKKHFDELRKNYPIRREFNNYTIKLSGNDGKVKQILSTLRFKVI
ncbi:MAG: 4-phosphoerythronate dehydrogenase [Ignavibacteriales bacterium]|nr:4-phosphoerythronate dehydrogenase [Ignavibacteriales bacterium]